MSLARTVLLLGIVLLAGCASAPGGPGGSATAGDATSATTAMATTTMATGDGSMTTAADATTTASAATATGTTAEPTSDSGAANTTTPDYQPSENPDPNASANLTATVVDGAPENATVRDYSDPQVQNTTYVRKIVVQAADAADGGSGSAVLRVGGSNYETVRTEVESLQIQFETEDGAAHEPAAYVRYQGTVVEVRLGAKER